MLCSDCGSDMKKTRIEWVCFKCGMVSELIDFRNICDFCQRSQGSAVYPWEANIPQTKKMYFWKGGKMILKIGKRFAK